MVTILTNPDGIDMTLWDTGGKAGHVPPYPLFGGTWRVAPPSMNRVTCRPPSTRRTFVFWLLGQVAFLTSIAKSFPTQIKRNDSVNRDTLSEHGHVATY